MMERESMIFRGRETEPTRSLRIGVDVDEVLAQLVKAFLEHHFEQTGNRYEREAMRSYNFWDLWDGTREEAIELVNAFYDTERFRELEPVSGSVEAIPRIGRVHELVVITSRPNQVTDHTHEWLGRYFPGAFSEIHLTNHFSNGEALTKVEVCDRLGIELMVEDSLEYAHECAAPERPVILLDSPWNRGQELPGHVVRATDWPDIERRIEEIASS